MKDIERGDVQLLQGHLRRSPDLNLNSQVNIPPEVTVESTLKKK